MNRVLFYVAWPLDPERWSLGPTLEPSCPLKIVLWVSNVKLSIHIPRQPPAPPGWSQFSPVESVSFIFPIFVNEVTRFTTLFLVYTEFLVGTVYLVCVDSDSVCLLSTVSHKCETGPPYSAVQIPVAYFWLF